MAVDIRIGTFNVENLFGRAKLLNLNNHSIGDAIIRKVAQFQIELKRSEYDKPKILQLYRDTKSYINIVETRRRLFRRRGYGVVGVKANGVNDWDGFIDFKQAKLNDTARENTGRVIKELRADVMCLIEVENRPVLKRFNSQVLRSRRYPYNMVIDGNDNRGIDVGLLSKLEIGGVWTHIFDGTPSSRVFSRDCLEVELRLPQDDRSLWLLINHFKSKGYGTQATSNARRKRQAERVAEILTDDYDLRSDLVIVTGDLNDTPDSAPLHPLLSLTHLHDTLELQFPNTPGQRWTYHYNTNEQIDYILVSDPLRDAFRGATLERRGIYGVDSYTGGAIQPFSEVTKYTESASDHAGVCAEFRI